MIINLLIFACFKGHFTIVKFLIKHEANINQEYNDGNTPLIFEFVKKKRWNNNKASNWTWIKQLDEHRANVNKKKLCQMGIAH